MKVDFYILEAETSHKMQFFACQLIEKAHAENKTVYVQTGSLSEAERFDQLLWTFREDSFLPHQLYHPNEKYPAPIQIGFNETESGEGHFLINLCSKFPSFYQRFEHIIEIVFSDPLVQQLARERYKQYRDLGCDMNTYKLKANEI